MHGLFWMHIILHFDCVPEFFLRELILKIKSAGDTKKKHEKLHSTSRQRNVTNGPRRQKTCLQGFGNNTGADQPAHMRSLIRAFVIRFQEKNICRLATDEISIFWLVSIAEESVLKLALSETLKTDFLSTMPKEHVILCIRKNSK